LPFLNESIGFVAMRRRWLSVALAIFEAFWLNVVVPGHKRGIVQMPGAPGGAVCACCCDQTGNSEQAGGSKKDSSQGSAATCAICNFAAHLSVPPIVDFTPPKLKLLCQATSEVVRGVIARNPLIPFDGRGPPRPA
jgi:hypothetical protein